MAIIETKIGKRTNPSIPFFYDTDEKNNFIDADMATLRSNGNITTIKTLSEDGLTQTVINTIDTLANYSIYDTALGIALDNAYVEYTTTNSFLTFRDNTFTPFTLSGIDSPFTATIVYTFPTPDIAMEIFANSISLINGFDVVVGANTVTVTRQFADSSDYTANYFQDLIYAQQLNAKGVTRTHTYTAV